MKASDQRSRSIVVITTSLLLAMTSGCGKALPVSPSLTPSATEQATQAPAAEPTALASATAVATPVYTVVPEFEGYYMGTVVIAGYYTLLEKELFADAYQLLSASQQRQYSLPQYQGLQRNAGKVAEIITVQPVRAKQAEEHLPVTSQDTATAITFYVRVRLAAPENMPATSLNSGIQTQYLVLTKEGDLWRIGASSPSLEVANPPRAAPQTIDPAFVFDLSYYDSLVGISRYYTYFNHGLYKDAYALRSSSDPHLPGFADWVAGFKAAEIKVNSIVEIYPLYEPIEHFQYRPTPDPVHRREFYAKIYAEGAHGMAGSVTNGVYTYFITTLLENGGWKVYSVSTSP